MVDQQKQYPSKDDTSLTQAEGQSVEPTVHPDQKSLIDSAWDDEAQPTYGQSQVMGTAAVVIGSIAIVVGFLSPLFGIVLGIVAIILAFSQLRDDSANGRAKAGRICGIVAIAVSLLVFLISLAFSFGFIFGNTPSSANPTNAVDGVTSSSDGGTNQAIVQPLEELLNGIQTEDGPMMQTIADLADEGFTETMKYSMQDAGIDPLDYAQTMAEGFSYVISEVQVDPTGLSAKVSVDIQVKNLFTATKDFQQRVKDFNSSGATANMDTQQARQEVGVLFMEAVKAAPIGPNYATYSLEFGGGSWHVTQNSWDQELSYMFGVS